MFEDDNLTSDPEGTGQSDSETEQTNEAGEETPPEKTPITDEERKKYGIPEKFKYMEDVIKWGSEAEKAKSHAEQEKARLERELEEREAIIAELEKTTRQQEQQGKITEEERIRMNEEFQENLARDPIGTMEKLFNAFERRLQAKREAAELEQKWQKEEETFRKLYPDNWDTEIRPALAKIATDRPYLQSIEEVLAIYEAQKRREERLSKEEAEEKKTAKNAAFSEAGTGSGAGGSDLYERIANAKSLEELEKVTARIPRAVRD